MEKLSIDQSAEIMSVLTRTGVKIDNIDYDTFTVSLSIPKKSYFYKPENIVHDAASYAKRIKETWIELGLLPPYGKIKYREIDIDFTEEMGHVRILNLLDEMGKDIKEKMEKDNRKDE